MLWVAVVVTLRRALVRTASAGVWEVVEPELEVDVPRMAEMADVITRVELVVVLVVVVLVVVVVLLVVIEVLVEVVVVLVLEVVWVEVDVVVLVLDDVLLVLVVLVVVWVVEVVVVLVLEVVWVVGMEQTYLESGGVPTATWFWLKPRHTFPC